MDACGFFIPTAWLSVSAAGGRMRLFIPTELSVPASRRFHVTVTEFKRPVLMGAGAGKAISPLYQYWYNTGSKLTRPGPVAFPGYPA
jgi:hypothetical protein